MALIEGPKHTVRVYFYEETKTVGEPYLSPIGLKLFRCEGTGEFLPERDVEHPEECDRLKYGQQCDLDHLSSWLDESDWPQEPGTYHVWTWYDPPSPYWEDDADEGLSYERIGDLPENVPAYTRYA